jgi:L-aspartate oxidase
MMEKAGDNAVRHWRTNVVVVGSGVAGLACALALAPLPVTLLTKTAQAASGSSVWAKGGVAAAVGPGDTPELHAADTIAAGAGLVDAALALTLAREGAETVRALADGGVPFDRTADGALALGREAAHGEHRIVHAGGDATGRLLVEALLERAHGAPSINVLSNCLAVDLLVQQGRVRGLLALDAESGWITIHANRVVLAAGGIGGLWRDTTNPPENTGDGVAIAARAGASLADMEFMQFHPTALVPRSWSRGEPLPLLTEALRGAGAILLDETGQRFMLDEHPLAELAPRDVVARAIARRTSRSEPVLLDMRPAIAARGVDAFPQAVLQCRAAGYEPLQEPVPVAAAAHYHMGGVLTDGHGRTGIDGLWACGEVACTGVHGANRLASNSLLEGLVFGRRVAADIRSAGRSESRAGEARTILSLPSPDSGQELERLRAALRQTMSEHVGIVRTAEGLAHAQAALTTIGEELAGMVEAGSPAGDARADYTAMVQWCELRNMLLAAQLVTTAALRRTESRGAHFRLDHPETLDDWAVRQVLNIADIETGYEGASRRASC